MKVSKGLLCAALSLAALAAATPAAAQRVDRIVAFGDSYADDGNLFELIGIPRPAVYPNGRFSDGTNFIDTMSQLLNAPVDNFAIGGAFTGNGNINGPGIPGFVTEWQSFLAGGGPAAFPRVDGTFGPNDLVAISIGGNDARAYERSLGLAPTPAQISGLIAGAPAQAALRVAETTTGLNALVGAGARNITFIAGDVGRLPEVAGLPVAAVGSAYATAYNEGMQVPLANLAAQGVIVNYVDLNLLGDRVAANLAAFGLTSAGACPIACVTTNPSMLREYPVLCRSGPPDLGRLRDRRRLCGAPARSAAPPPGAGRCRSAHRERVRRHDGRAPRFLRRGRDPGAQLLRQRQRQQRRPRSVAAKPRLRSRRVRRQPRRRI